MTRLEISHDFLSIGPSPDQWSLFLKSAEDLLGSRLTHLDVNDPVRRKISTLDEAGKYIGAFGAREDSRWLFGEFRDIGCDLSIDLQRNSLESYNCLRWYVPISFTQENVNWGRLKALFDLGNQMLAPFYAYAEDSTWMQDWSKPLLKRPERTHPERELLGVFWMTYFNAAYVEFFGADRFSSLSHVKYDANGGATITLADRPQNVPDGLRDQVAATLGKQSFVELDTKYVLPKRQGKHVLTFDQLRAFDAQRRE